MLLVTCKAAGHPRILERRLRGYPGVFLSAWQDDHQSVHFRSQALLERLARPQYMIIGDPCWHFAVGLLEGSTKNYTPLVSPTSSDFALFSTRYSGTRDSSPQPDNKPVIKSIHPRSARSSFPPLPALPSAFRYRIWLVAANSLWTSNTASQAQRLNLPRTFALVSQKMVGRCGCKLHRPQLCKANPMRVPKSAYFWQVLL